MERVHPMKARDVLGLMDFQAEDPFGTPGMNLLWDDDAWLAEEKLDGHRYTLYIGKDGECTYISSGGKDRTANFPHLRYVQTNMLEGTIIDGEIRCPKAVIVANSGQLTKRTTQSTGAIANSLPATGVRLQEENDAWVEFFAFDIVELMGTNVRDRSYERRRKALEGLILDLGGYIKMPRYSVMSKRKLFDIIIAEGGEGVILKKLDAPYLEGKRPDTMYKVKSIVTVDAYVTGYKPGNAKHEGKVGSIEFCVKIGDKEHVVGYVGALDDSFRDEITSEDGTLRGMLMGAVAELRGQCVTKNGRFQHCQIVQWRDDKDWKECDGYELEGLL